MVGWTGEAKGLLSRKRVHFSLPRRMNTYTIRDRKAVRQGESKAAREEGRGWKDLGKRPPSPMPTPKRDGAVVVSGRHKASGIAMSLFMFFFPLLFSWGSFTPGRGHIQFARAGRGKGDKHSAREILLPFFFLQTFIVARFFVPIFFLSICLGYSSEPG